MGLVHGKMNAKEKDTVMDDFRNGKISVLISTTVIEVGVDVPNATVMMVRDAHRFGLASFIKFAAASAAGYKAIVF